MNDAVHQLFNLISQGITWVLRTLEKMWIWSWAQIQAAFNVSWDSLPAWKVLIGVVAIIALATFVVMLFSRSIAAFRNIAHAFWTMAMAAFGIVAVVLMAGVFSRGFVWIMTDVSNDVFARLP
jgi:hypothetical protein